jgi:hypothetical protein
MTDTRLQELSERLEMALHSKEHYVDRVNMVKTFLHLVLQESREKSDN